MFLYYHLSCCYARVVSSRPTPSSLCAIPSFLSLACSTVPAFCPLQYRTQLSVPCSTMPAFCPLQYRASFLPLAVPYPAFCPLQYRVPSFLSLAVPYLAFCPLQYHILALFPGHYQILSRSCGEEFLNNCKIKSGVAWE